MGGKGQAGRRTDHLRVRRNRSPRVPDPLLRQELQPDLTGDEKKQLRQIAANLKGAQLDAEENHCEKEPFWCRPD